MKFIKALIATVFVLAVLGQALPTLQVMAATDEIVSSANTDEDIDNNKEIKSGEDIEESSVTAEDGNSEVRSGVVNNYDPANEEILTLDEMTSIKNENGYNASSDSSEITGLLRAAVAEKQFVYSSTSGSGQTMYLYYPEKLTTIHSYINCAGYLMEYIGVNALNSNYYNVRFMGTVVAVKKSDVSELLAQSQIKSFPYYMKDSSGKLVYYIENNPKADNSYIFISRLGDAPSWMETNKKYYSFDGIYFKDDISKLGTENSATNSVNANTPFLIYFNTLSARSKTNYTASQLNSAFKYYYENSSYSGKATKMLNTGQAFVNAQNKYGTNALLVMAMGIHESAYGTSAFAIERNNLFGVNAVDSDPGQASYFPSINEGIDAQGFFLSDGYATNDSSKYYGFHVGNKLSGMNVKYASDPFWGYKIAGHMEKFDEYLGGQDGGQNAIGMINEQTQVYKNTNGSTWFKYAYGTARETLIYPVIILGESGDYYEVQLDSIPTNRNDGYSFGNQDGTYNFSTNIGYIKKSDFAYVQGNIGNLNAVSASYYEGFVQSGNLIIQGTTTNGTSAIGINNLSADFKNTSTSTTQPMSIGLTTVSGRINYSLSIATLNVGTYEINVKRGTGQTVITADAGLNKTISLNNGKVASLLSINGKLTITITLADAISANYYSGFIQGSSLIIQATTSDGSNLLAIDGVSASLKVLSGNSGQTMAVSGTTVAGRINYSMALDDLKVGSYEVIVSRGNSSVPLKAESGLNTNLTLSDGRKVMLSYNNGNLRLDITDVSSTLSVNYYEGFIQGNDLIIQGTSMEGDKFVGVDDLSAELKNTTNNTTQTMKVGATTVIGRINYSLAIDKWQEGAYEILVSNNNNKTIMSAASVNKIINLNNGKKASITSQSGKLLITITPTITVNYYEGFIQGTDFIIQGTSMDGNTHLLANELTASIQNTTSSVVQPMKVGATTVSGRVNYSLSINNLQVGTYKILVNKGSEQTAITASTINKTVDLNNGMKAELTSLNGILLITISPAINISYYDGFTQGSDFVIQGTSMSGNKALLANELTAELKNVNSGVKQNMKIGATTVAGRINYSLALANWQVGEYELIVKNNNVSVNMELEAGEQLVFILPKMGKELILSKVDGKLHLSVKTISLASKYLFSMVQDGQFKIQGDTQNTAGALSASQVSASLVNINTFVETDMKIGATTKSGYINYGLDLANWQVGEYEVKVKTGNTSTVLSTSLIGTQTYLLSWTNKIAIVSNVDGKVRITIKLV